MDEPLAGLQKLPLRVSSRQQGGRRAAPLSRLRSDERGDAQRKAPREAGREQGRCADEARRGAIRVSPFLSIVVPFHNSAGKCAPLLEVLSGVRKEDEVELI